MAVMAARDRSVYSRVRRISFVLAALLLLALAFLTIWEWRSLDASYKAVCEAEFQDAADLVCEHTARVYNLLVNLSSTPEVKTVAALTSVHNRESQNRIVSMMEKLGTMCAAYDDIFSAQVLLKSVDRIIRSDGIVSFDVFAKNRLCNGFAQEDVTSIARHEVRILANGYSIEGSYSGGNRDWVESIVLRSYGDYLIAVVPNTAYLSQRVLPLLSRTNGAIEVRDASGAVYLSSGNPDLPMQDASGALFTRTVPEFGLTIVYRGGAGFLEQSGRRFYSVAAAGMIMLLCVCVTVYLLMRRHIVIPMDRLLRMMGLEREDTASSEYALIGDEFARLHRDMSRVLSAPPSADPEQLLARCAFEPGSYWVAVVKCEDSMDINRFAESVSEEACASVYLVNGLVLVLRADAETAERLTCAFESLESYMLVGVSQKIRCAEEVASAYTEALATIDKMPIARTSRGGIAFAPNTAREYAIRALTPETARMLAEAARAEDGVRIQALLRDLLTANETAPYGQQVQIRAYLAGALKLIAGAAGAKLSGEAREKLEQLLETQQTIDLRRIDQTLAEAYKLTAKGMESAHSPVTERLISYIDAHYGEDISLSQLAERFGVSAGYLSAKVKEELGQTYIFVLQTRRVEAAIRMLTESALSIAEIAEKVGYQNAASFIRVFKRETGFTPNQYRLSSRAMALDATISKEQEIG